jgi:Ca-activated chloride channel family protein
MSKRVLLIFLVAVCIGLTAVAGDPQSTGPKPPATGTVVPKKTTTPQQEQSTTTGPKTEVGETVIVPRTARPPQKSKPRQPSDTPDGGQPFAINVSVDLVTLDAVVQDNKGQLIPGLKKTNFRIYEDGVPQQLQTFDASESPMTVVLLVEFNNLFQRFYTEMWYQTLTASYGFVQTLRKEDWLALVAYDLRPEILLDFTQNKEAAQGALGRLRFPAFSEANLFDALDFTIDRMKDVAGKKGIVLVATGIDTFSKITYDKAMKKVKEGEVPIYSISIGQVVRELADARGAMGAIARMDFLQADNALRTFAADSGGHAWFPRFYGEFPSIFQEISSLMRNQYTLGYVPTNLVKDGKFRKLKVELVDERGNPLKVVDQKGKDVKYKITAKQGYYASKGEQIVN